MTVRAPIRSLLHHVLQPHNRRGADLGGVCRHNPIHALGTFGMLLLISVPIWIVTPFISSFGTYVIPAMMQATFVAGDNNGTTRDDAPIALYTLLAATLVAFASAVLITDLILGTRPRYRILPITGAIVGFGLFLFTLNTLGGALWQWTVAPTALLLGHISAQALTTTVDRAREFTCWDTL